MNQSPNEKRKKPETKVISKMMRRVYQHDEFVQSQYSGSQSHAIGSAQKSSSGKRHDDTKSYDVTQFKFDQQQKGLIEELQEIHSFQPQNQESELIHFDQTQRAQSDLTTRLFDLPQQALRLLLACLLEDYRNLNLVSAKWYVGIHQTLNEWLEEVDNKFLKANMHILTIKNSFLSFTPFKVNQRQCFRLDRCIVAEVLPGYEGKCIAMGCIFKLTRGQQGQFRSEYKFDVLSPKENRTLWMLKEQVKHNYDEEVIVQTSQIAQVCSEDNIRISLNFFNLTGLIDLDSVVWEQPLFEPSPKVDHIKGKKNLRSCHLERQYQDWILYEYFPNEQHRVKIDKFSPQLVLKDSRCAGIDTVINRMIYVADCKGFIPNGELGMPVQVMGQKEELTVEVRKLGLIADLQLPIQLRKGDQIVFYLTKGD